MDHQPTTTNPSFTSPSRTHLQNPVQASFSGERTANPQWGQQETVELITIRGQLERDFMASKRNKALWESVACQMREKGFVRNPDQCKCKWKNLVNRYKGKESSEFDKGKQCPFFEEMHAIFSAQGKNLHQSFMKSLPAVVSSRKKLKTDSGDHISDYFSQDEDDEVYNSNEESHMRSSSAQKRKADRGNNDREKTKDKYTDPTQASSAHFGGSSSILELLKGFFQQQKNLDMQWQESLERHQCERKRFEQEWRKSMERLERERLVLDQEWTEKEEQREMKEELRSERRDALLTTLLNKLINQERV